MDKILFTINVHSVVDVITNSSSELFVGKHQSKEIMKEMIKQIYPNYLNEYEELKTINELSNNGLYVYISYHYESWRKSNLIKGFSFDEMYEKKGDWTYIKNDFVEDNRERIINAIDPERKMFFLFSVDDNPDFEMQEKLENIMTRYHLG